MIGYHVTTQKKLAKYEQTGCILEPVRFWTVWDSAKAWAKKTGRVYIVKFDVPPGSAYPLPDHKPRGHAWWTDQNIRKWSLWCV